MFPRTRQPRGRQQEEFPVEDYLPGWDPGMMGWGAFPYMGMYPPGFSYLGMLPPHWMPTAPPAWEQEEEYLPVSSPEVQMAIQLRRFFTERPTRALPARAPAAITAAPTQTVVVTVGGRSDRRATDQGGLHRGRAGRRGG